MRRRARRRAGDGVDWDLHQGGWLEMSTRRKRHGEIMVGLKYVAPSPLGNDANSGDTEAAPYQHIAFAVKSLPIINPGTAVQRHVGQVIVAPGLYVESDTPIPFHAGTQIIGMGSAFSATIVQLAAGKNGPLFSFRENGNTNESGSPPDYVDYLGGAMLANMQIDGNKTNNSLAGDLIRLINGGYGCVLRDLHVRNAKGFGVYIQRNALALRLDNVNIAKCDGGAVDFRHDGTSSTNLVFQNSEIDDCGLGGAGSCAIRIRRTNLVGTGQVNNIITLRNVKGEFNSTFIGAESMIRHELSPVAGAPGFIINVEGCNGLNSNAGFTKRALIVEANGAGNKAYWQIRGCASANQWAGTVFVSDKSGTTLAGPVVQNATA